MSQGVRGGLTPRRLVAHTLSAPPWRRIGAELATVRMLSYLAESGWSPVVVPHSVRWPKGESARRIAPGVWAASPDLAMSSTPALVYGHVPFVEKARRHAEQAGAPLVMAAHGGPPGWLAAQVTRAAPDLVVANSKTMAVGLRRTSVPVHVQRPPVFPEDSAPIVDPDRYGTFVTLVNGSKDKGGELVAQIARRMPDLRFLIVTGGYGEQVAALRTLPNVEVIGHQDDMRAVWARTAVLLVPSVEESWGMAAVEAMSAGIPVLGSPALGLHECLGREMLHPLPLDDEGAWCSAIRDALGPMREHLHVAALRRAFELDPAAHLRSTHRRFAGLIGWDIPMSALRYRNVRTGEQVDVDPGSPQERRLERLSLVWEKVADDAPPTPVTAERQTGEPDADPSLTLSPPPAPPKPSAKLADWQAYAIARGGDEAAVKAAPKGALVALYG